MIPIDPHRDKELLNILSMTRREFKDLVFEARAEHYPLTKITLPDSPGSQKPESLEKEIGRSS